MRTQRDYPEPERGSDSAPGPERALPDILARLASLVEGMDKILSRELQRLSDEGNDLLKQGLFWRNSLALFVMAQIEDLDHRLARTQQGGRIFSLSPADADTLRSSTRRLFSQLGDQIESLKLDGTGHYPLVLDESKADLLRYAGDSHRAIQNLTARGAVILPSVTLRTRIERLPGHEGQAIADRGESR